MQTYPAFEILIVDDMSTNIGRVRELENEFRNDARLRFIYAEEKLFAGGARQRGSDEAKGDAIVYIDSDDVMHSKRLELSVRFMNEHPDCSFLLSGYVPFSNLVPIEMALDYVIAEKSCKFPQELTKRLAKRFSTMRLSWIDPDLEEVPWYAWGSIGAKSKYPSASGSFMIRRELMPTLRWSDPKSYVFTPYEDYEYCLLAHTVTSGGYQLDVPMLYYRKGSTTNNPAEAALE